MEVCEFCRCSNGNHHKGCPTAIGTPEAKKLFDQGKKLGQNDVFIHPNTWGEYDPPFILGYENEVKGSMEFENRMSL